MEDKNKWERLMDLIPHGAENAISMKTLSVYLGTDDRETRQLIWNARADGELIMSGQTGYFRPVTRDELRNYYRFVSKRQKSTALALEAVRRELEGIGETME